MIIGLIYAGRRPHGGAWSDAVSPITREGAGEGLFHVDSLHRRGRLTILLSSSFSHEGAEPWMRTSSHSGVWEVEVYLLVCVDQQRHPPDLLHCD
jgi:hypothetical protein